MKITASAFWLVACGLCLFACSCSKDNASAKDPRAGAGRPALITAALVGTRTVPVTISTFGTIEASSSIVVKAQVSGILTKVHFGKGQLLKKGQLLFTIDPRQYQAALDQAKANLLKDQVLLDNEKRNLEHAIDLYTHGKFATKDEVDQARTIVDAQAATIKADQAMIDKADIDLDNCSISCPIDGKAGDLLVTEGNLVRPNDLTLVSVNQVQPIELFFSIPQEELGTVRRRMAKETLKVDALLPAQEGGSQTGDLFFVDNTVDRMTGTIRLGARFGNRDLRLWPGQYVRVNLTLSLLRDAVVVPIKAVQVGRDGKFVYIVKSDNTVQTRPVTPGIRVGEIVVIDKGVQPGETVVTDGQLRLIDGAAVEIQADKPAGAAATAPATMAAAPETKP